ncbi:hypothetical protein D7030_04180 [Flavobacteriaceae bacterium AU392]|nr:hypothetical protein D1817_10655 [Flavobacteriaceae bacterium]RKM85875.1 hypothetical protein D7030_04180 [Flavobacteriaceae bacterium AU392]
MKSLFLKIIILNLFTLSFYSCAQSIEKVEFLTGTWKVEGRDTYENWQKDNNTLIGKSYKIKDNKEHISETLSITTTNNIVTYTATVLNQNDGKGIDFILNSEVTKKLSFENLNHDFPKKIQYTKLSNTEVFVEVFGEGDKGFSYKMFKQE